MQPTARTLWILTLAAVSLAVSAHPLLAGSADLVARGRQALDAGRAEEALGLFEQAVIAGPDDPAALAWLGSAQAGRARAAPLLERPGWVRKGFRSLDRAVERFPEASIVYVVRGLTAAQVPDFFGKAAVAERDLARVVSLREANPAGVPDEVMPRVYLHLGLVLKRMGRADEARAVWEQALRAYPAAPEARAIAAELGAR